MNEFIVWNKKKNKFENNIYNAYRGDLLEFVRNSAGSLAIRTVNSIYSAENESLKGYDCVAYDYISIKDINNNKIYADSSIIEFDLGLYSNRKKVIGYFTFNDILLNYEILILNNAEVNCEAIIDYNPFTCMNFKIIDTIQVNKLGLING